MVKPWSELNAGTQRREGREGTQREYNALGDRLEDVKPLGELNAGTRLPRASRGRHGGRDGIMIDKFKFSRGLCSLKLLICSIDLPKS
jgi:hypothetical protein